MKHDTANLPGAKPTTKILKSKLLPPVTGANHLQRVELLEKIQDADAPRLVLIRAAAGFGKTTLMQQYRSLCVSSQRKAIWLNLDVADNDLNRFVAHLQAGFDESATTPPAPSAASEQVYRSAHLAFEFLDFIACQDRPFSILLDEFEVIQSSPVLDFIRQLLEALPPCGMIMITSRTTPDIGLGRIRARGQLLEINPRSLRFSLEEATSFIRDKRLLPLHDSEIATLHRCTEGWAAAIFLATLSLHNRTDHSAFVASFSGSNLELAEYLTEDILIQQSEDCRQFLIETSVLPKLTAELCDAITGRNDSQTMIDFLEKANLFLLPLDGESNWYRYHSLFASFLRGVLNKQHPGRALELQRKAAQWYLSIGRPVPAIEHLLNAGAMTEAVVELAAHANDLMESGRARLLLRWLERLPTGSLDEYPSLALTYAWALTLCRRFKDAMRVINRFLQAGPLDGDQQRYALEAETVHCLLLAMTEQVEDCCAAGMAQLDRLAVEQSFQHGLVANALAYSLVCTNQYDEARRIISRAIRVTGSDPLSYMRYMFDCIESVIDIVQGRLGNAVARLQGTLQRHRQKAVAEDIVGIPPINSTLAQALYELDALADVELNVLEALPFSKIVGAPDALVANYILMARLAYLKDDKDTWQRYLADLEHEGRQIDSSRVICSAWLERARVATIEGRLDSAEQALRAAELHADWERPGVSMHTTDVEMPSIARWRLRIALGDCVEPAEALALAITTAQTQQRYRRVLKLRLLRAMALDGQGQTEAAFEELADALRFASHEGFFRTFLDEGPKMAILLHRWRVAFQPRAAGSGIDANFLDKLLERSKSLAGFAEAHSKETEILSAREIQVLALLAVGHRNRAIGEKMFLSEFTIKSHLRNIYTKLGTHGRTEAVTIARQKGLIE